MAEALRYVRKPYASSILLWMRTDQPRQEGDGPLEGPALQDHQRYPGFEEYRQIHLAATNPGL